MRVPYQILSVACIVLASLSGCFAPPTPATAADGTDTTAAGDNETGPTAQITVIVNGTQVYPSEEDDSGTPSASPEQTNGSAPPSTSTSGNSTDNDTSSPANSTSASPDNSTQPTNTTTGAPSNSTTADEGNGTNGNDTGGSNTTADVTVAPGENVTFDATASEGTNLTFEWSIGDNTTSENDTVTHVFNETGVYTVTLTVMDGDNNTDSQSIEVAVENAGAESGTVVAEEKQTFNGGAVQGGTPTCTSLSGGLTDKTYELVLNDTVNGTPAVTGQVQLAATYGSAGYGARLTFADPNGEELGEETDELTIEGPLPAGTYTITYRLCGPYSSHSTVDVTVTYVAP